MNSKMNATEGTRVSFLLQAPKNEAVATVEWLYRLAQRSGFPRVYKILHLFGAECELASGVPTELLTFYGRGTALAGHRACSIQPDEIIAFGIQLPNKRIVPIGLSLYPREVIDSTGERYATPWLNTARWSGEANTCNSGELDLASHRLFGDFLQEAKNHGVVQCIHDPFKKIAGSNCMGFELEACVPV